MSEYQPPVNQTWRHNVGEILINRRYNPPKEVTITTINYKEDSNADWILTSDSRIYGCAIALYEDGWFKKRG